MLVWRYKQQTPAPGRAAWECVRSGSVRFVPAQSLLRRHGTCPPPMRRPARGSAAARCDFAPAQRHVSNRTLFGPLCVREHFGSVASRKRSRAVCAVSVDSRCSVVDEGPHPASSLAEPQSRGWPPDPVAQSAFCLHLGALTSTRR